MRKIHPKTCIATGSKTIRKHLPFFLLLFLPTSSNAQTASDVISLSASIKEGNHTNGKEEIQFMIEKNQGKRMATLHLTSNFLQGAAEVVKLGVFRSFDLRRMEREKNTIQSWQELAAQETKQYAKIHRHKKGDIEVSAGGFPLDPFSPIRSDILTFLEKVFSYGSWQAFNAVEVRKKANDPTVIIRYLGLYRTREKTSIEKMDCKKEKDFYICLIPKYGLAYLLL